MYVYVDFPMLPHEIYDIHCGENEFRLLVPRACAPSLPFPSLPFPSLPFTPSPLLLLSLVIIIFTTVYRPRLYP